MCSFTTGTQNEQRQKDTQRRAEALRAHVQRYRSNAAHMQHRHLRTMERRESAHRQSRHRHTVQAGSSTSRRRSSTPVPRGAMDEEGYSFGVRSSPADLRTHASATATAPCSPSSSSSVLASLLSSSSSTFPDSSCVLSSLLSSSSVAPSASSSTWSARSCSPPSSQIRMRAALQQQHRRKLVHAACTELEHRCQQTWQDIQQLQVGCSLCVCVVCI
jgi:hypothetical protein